MREVNLKFCNTISLNPITLWFQSIYYLSFADLLLLIFERLEEEKKKKIISTNQILKIKMCAEENICWVVGAWVDQRCHRYLRRRDCIGSDHILKNMLLRITSITDNRNNAGEKIFFSLFVQLCTW